MKRGEEDGRRENERRRRRRTEIDARLWMAKVRLRECARFLLTFFFANSSFAHTNGGQFVSSQRGGKFPIAAMIRWNYFQLKESVRTTTTTLDMADD